VRFIEEHKNRQVDGGLRWGVEPICEVLTEHGVGIARCDADPRRQLGRRRSRHLPGGAPLICKLELAYSHVVADVFRALDDETRRLVLDELAASNGKTLFEICSLLTMRHGVSLTRQAISQHLGVLESAGLVVTERRGRSKFHYFNPEPLAEITRRWSVGERIEQ
jgi:DNA-binding transcriptional ArsR family regulator